MHYLLLNFILLLHDQPAFDFLISLSALIFYEKWFTYHQVPSRNCFSSFQLTEASVCIWGQKVLLNLILMKSRKMKVHDKLSCGASLLRSWSQILLILVCNDNPKRDTKSQENAYFQFPCFRQGWIHRDCYNVLASTVDAARGVFPSTRLLIG